MTARRGANPGAPRTDRVVLNDQATRVLLAVLLEPHPTVTTIADLCDLTRYQVHAQLKMLKAAGFIDWEKGKNGTLRPRVEHVGIRAVLDA